MMIQNTHPMKLDRWATQSHKIHHLISETQDLKKFIKGFMKWLLKNKNGKDLEVLL